MSDSLLVRFLDSEGRVKIWPSKVAVKLLVLEYISEKFEIGRDYSEREVNAVLNEWHTFRDYFLLRRGIVDAGFLKRTKDGSRYWKEESKINGE